MKVYGVLAFSCMIGCAQTVATPDLNSGLDGGVEQLVDGGQEPAVDAGPPPAFLGSERLVPTLLPDAWNRNQTWPLVIVLHGYTSSGGGQDAYLGVSERRNDFGFIALAPDGTRNPQRQRFWNATSACCDFWNSGVDDVSYIVGLIDEAVERLNVDPDRVYLIGHSNGGFMSNRIACDAADKVTAIFNIAGSGFSNETRCEPSESVGYIQAHGTNDTVIRYPGGTIQGGAYPSAGDLVDRWKERNGCQDADPQTLSADFDNAVPGEETTQQVWASCASERSVQLWEMVGTGHVPSFNDGFRDAMLEALLAYR